MSQGKERQGFAAAQKSTERGLVLVKRPGVLRKAPLLEVLLGVWGVLSPLPISIEEALVSTIRPEILHALS